MTQINRLFPFRSVLILLSLLLANLFSTNVIARGNPNQNGKPVVNKKYSVKHKAPAKLRKYFLSPDLSLGLNSGYDHSKSLKLDLGNPGAAVKMELLAGRYINEHWCIYTGVGYCLYDYRMRYGSGPSLINDTVRNQSEDIIEIPLGVRYTSTSKKLFKTKHYFGAGLRFCLLDDARSDYHSVDLLYSNKETRQADFNAIYVRLFVEAGIDVPLDYYSSFLLGVNVSDGITRNMSKTGIVANANYGMLSASLTLGFRFSLGL